MSQNLTLPFKYSTAFAVETHVNAGTIASSLALKPRAARERCNALVQEVTAIEYLDSVYFENFFQIREHIDLGPTNQNSMV